MYLVTTKIIDISFKRLGGQNGSEQYHCCYLLVHIIIRIMTVTGTELSLISNPQKVGLQSSDLIKRMPHHC